MTQHPWAAGRSGVHLASRRILLTACGEHPGRAWAAQQVRNLAWHPMAGSICHASAAASINRATLMN